MKICYQKIILILIIIIAIFSCSFKVQAKYNFKYTLKAFSILSNINKKTNSKKIPNTESRNDNVNIDLAENEEYENEYNQVEEKNEIGIKYVIIKHKKNNN